jgi:hypothetical protein
MQRSISITSRFVASTIPVEISLAAAATIRLSLGGDGIWSSAVENGANAFPIAFANSGSVRSSAADTSKASVRDMTVAV